MFYVTQTKLFLHSHLKKRSDLLQLHLATH